MPDPGVRGSDALKRDPRNPGLMFDAGMIANIEHREDNALQWIDQALRAGYSRSEIAREKELDNLRDGRLQQLLRQTATMASGSRS